MATQGVQIDASLETSAARKRLSEAAQRMDLSEHPHRVLAEVIAEIEQAGETEQLRLVALLHVAHDLLAQTWQLVQSPDGLFLQRPGHHSARAEQSATKAILRDQLHTARARQLETPSVRSFIRSAMQLRAHRGEQHSIRSLIRDGRDLEIQLRQARRLPPEAHAATLAELVSPYIQLVESNVRCQLTGLRLTDIWRYFRHTWANPYKSVPGRSMAILVRDAAQPSHPVIGIAAISSAVVQLGLRERYIGWDSTELANELHEAPTEAHAHWLEALVERSLGELYLRDFLAEGVITETELHAPPDGIHRRLVELSELERTAHEADDSSVRKARIDSSASDAEWEAQARTHLFRSKRARALAVLLRGRAQLHTAWGDAPSAEGVARLLASSEGRSQVQTLLKLAKQEKVGTAIADISVCGAVPPYSHLLGGKLVSMLVTSPEILALYRRRYAGMSSIIASSMAGRSIQRPAELVFLSTTSLYRVHASQYNRVRIPCERVGGDGASQVRFQKLGQAEGQGTLHFVAETSAALRALLTESGKGQRVNYKMGEGTSPRMRLIRDGLAELGIPESLLQHGNPRVLYGISLIRNTKEYLLGLEAEPDHLFAQDEPQERTQQICAWWRERWLSKRFLRDDVLERVGAESMVEPPTHGALVVLPEEEDDQLDLWGS